MLRLGVFLLLIVFFFFLLFLLSNPHERKPLPFQHSDKEMASGFPNPRAQEKGRPNTTMD
jgi:hypothetical protein